MTTFGFWFGLACGWGSAAILWAIAETLVSVARIEGQREEVVNE